MKKPAVILLHLGYWIMYVVLLLTFLALCAPILNPGKQLTFQFLLLHWWLPIMIGFAVVPALISFYSFYSVLFSRFLITKKIVSLVASAAGIVLLSVVIGQIIMYLIFPGVNWSVSTCVGMGAVMALNAFVSGVIGLVMKGFVTFYGDIQLKKDLRQKNYEMELALIKSQINPHFLFNTINNIDVLIGIDPQKASAYLNKLSDMMRFMLYETKPEKIALAKELSYIEKYIELQKIRTSNSNYVNYAVTGDSGPLSIAPMLFIPFIENAFKYAENKKAENAVNIKVGIEKNKIMFECINNYAQDIPVKPEQGGLGNDLIKKRLELLYPAKHSLEINDHNNTYSVKLTITG